MKGCFMLLCFTAALLFTATASDADSPQSLASKDLGSFWDGLMCAVGAVATPMTAVLYTTLRCMIEDGANLFECALADATDAIVSTVVVVSALCIMDPPSMGDNLVMDMARMLSEAILA
jgi:hypothetical protein